MTNGVVHSSERPEDSSAAGTSSKLGSSRSPPSTAQVTPLPCIEDFHVGRVLGDGSAVGPPTRDDEESYIPVALARAHLARVVHDMHTMKEDQTTKMNQILDRYKTIEAETKTYYENYVTELKRKAKDKFRIEQARYASLEAQSNEKQQQADQDIQRLEAANDQRRREHEQEKLRWREEVEMTFVRYEEDLTRFHHRVQHGMAAALQQQAESLSQSQADEMKRLEKTWQDTRADAEREMEETKQMLEQQLHETEATYETQIRLLERNADVDLETYKCVTTLVNRIVDMDNQTKRRKRSRELASEMETLVRHMNVSVAKERSLEIELHRLKEQYDAMEQRAVCQTMEVMLRTVELLPLESIEAKKAYAQVSMAKKTSVIEREAQTNDWAMVLVANTPSIPRVETCDASVEATQSVEQRDVAVEAIPEEPCLSQEIDPLSLASDPATQLQCEADAERLKARNAELIRSKNDLKVLKTQLQTSLELKNAAKAKIKRWLADFHKEHGRDPTIEEKAQVKDLYLAFKTSEEAYNAAKERVTTAKAAHHELVVEIEAVSQWHAVAATARASARSENLSVSRPDSAVSTTETTTLGATVTASLEEVETLAKEIESLRTELSAAYKAKKKANEEAERAVVEAKQAKADRLAVLDSNAVASEQREPGDKTQAKSRIDQQDTERRRHQEELETYARESESMERERMALQTSIARLRDELTARVVEKQDLETQIEQLRLHLELTDRHDDMSLLLESDAKGTSRDENDDDEDVGDVENEAKDEGDAKTSLLSVNTHTEAERTDGLKEAQLMIQIKEAIEAGKAQWNRGDKAKCFQIYVKMCDKCIEALRAPPPGRRDEVAAFKAALQEGGRLPPARGSMVLRRQLDNCLAACETRAKDRADREAAASFELAAAAKSPTRTTPASSPQRKSPHKKSVTSSLSDVSIDEMMVNSTTATTPVAGKALEEYKQKLKALETKAKADKVRITQLEASLSKAETQLMNATTSSGGAGSGANAVLLERKLAETEKKHTKALDEAEKTLKKEMTSLAQQLSASQTKSQSLQDQVDKLTQDLAVAGGRATQLSKMEEEVTILRAKAAQADTLSQDLATSKTELSKLEASYKEEQTLRKKYYNMIEDMKGKIRVYARCRPMSSSETERGCEPCVRFVDEFSLELKTAHGPKTFAYDQVFTPASTQDQVFEDTKNLLQSAVDGYNVCIFAYGQTGSGKTFTMTGSETLPGLSPRAIHHLFRLADESKGNNVVTFQAFMLELYNDNLIDLFYLVDGGGHDAPKLDIKKSDRGMVFVSNITTKSCTSAQQTLKLFEMANKKRQVGATKMNAESSRSHSVFSILVENYNKTTKTTTVGKLSLVDLAGSERAGKTGATNDRLKEAQAINKSLSALGDVIAALSAGEKFIPYRNNKLTQLMQDSLGGNAKTLMFVNISPADYNQEETQTSLQYASRVKLITNNANKTSESETVSRLKSIIKQLKAGKTDVELDGLGLE